VFFLFSGLKGEAKSVQNPLNGIIRVPFLYFEQLQILKVLKAAVYLCLNFYLQTI
jgi:hypothetical protein